MTDEVKLVTVLGAISIADCLVGLRPGRVPGDLARRGLRLPALLQVGCG
jgi:hypothetical protein